MWQGLVGIILVIYGFIKIFVGTTTVYASENFREKIEKAIPISKHLYVDDHSLAGVILEYIFIIFGIYSFLHGLAYLQVLPTKFGTFVNANNTAYWLYGVIGIFSIIFYYLVAYTNSKIPKESNAINRYKLVGILGGLLFLMTIPALMIFTAIIQEKQPITSPVVIASVLVLGILVASSYYLLEDTIPEKINTLNATSLVMIPFNMV